MWNNLVIIPYFWLLQILRTCTPLNYLKQEQMLTPFCVETCWLVNKDISLFCLVVNTYLSYPFPNMKHQNDQAHSANKEHCNHEKYTEGKRLYKKILLHINKIKLCGSCKEYFVDGRKVRRTFYILWVIRYNFKWTILSIGGMILYFTRSIIWKNESHCWAVISPASHSEYYVIRSFIIYIPHQIGLHY